MRITRILLQGFALFALSACSKTPADHTPLPPTPPQPPTDHLSGQLPLTLTATRGTDFYDFIRTVKWVDGKTLKRCTSTHCWWIFGKGKVHIETSENSNELDPRTVPRLGVAVAHVVDSAADSTITYGFKPGGYEYTFVVYPDTTHPNDSTSYWRLEETDPQHHTKAVPGKGGVFYPCRDYAPSNKDKIDFSKCFEQHSNPPINTSSFSLLGFAGSTDLLQAASSESPVWISCRAGCCTLATT